MTHLRDRERPLVATPDAELLVRYRGDLREVVGFDPEPLWRQVVRVPMYAPVFYRRFHNVPVRSASWSSVYFAGDYRTLPSVASAGTALRSGLEPGDAIVREHGLKAELPPAGDVFRLRSIPRA